MGTRITSFNKLSGRQRVQVIKLETLSRKQRALVVAPYKIIRNVTSKNDIPATNKSPEYSNSLSYRHHPTTQLEERSDRTWAVPDAYLDQRPRIESLTDKFHLTLDASHYHLN
ncbi:hypothetical protein EVAR_22135_1 [Eumeta japonica]|uniref:Uncharacterized protein n=1 Tax=Eumeta variegata TaxID=151549 RepID=A0A4C1VZJ3_EUMVA|nr:hypothetical protein EVAR_22135_1 [Eumeta japonica]